MPEIAVDTRFGRLGIVETDGAITSLRWDGRDRGAATDLLRAAARQLAEYDAGARRAFDLPLEVGGTALQRAVCAAIAAIPFGETRSYGEIAADLGQSAQVVGGACGGNPIPVLIPCHRVMGAGNRLVGFSGRGGVEMKVQLLRHEGAASLLI